MAMYETKGQGTGPKGEFQIKDLEEFCRRMRNAGASGTEIVKARVRFGGSVSELSVKINTSRLHNPLTIQEIQAAPASRKHADDASPPNVNWWCPEKGCGYMAKGDSDSPYDADLCPTHHKKIVLVDDL